jgi:crotonobetainyl-CoA:carnitine CoA-transferase CaiB-like acyl-CoA transferase
MSITGERDDLPGGGPQKAGVALTDLMTGMYATVAVLAALTHRDRTGEGQHIDMALLDVPRWRCWPTWAAITTTAASRPSAGAMRTPTSCPTRPSPVRTATSSSPPATTASTRSSSKRAGGRPGAPTRASPPTRCACRTATVLVPLLAEMVKTRTRDEWIAQLEAVGVPCGPINDLGEVFENPQVKARGVAVEMPHPAAGKVTLVRSPMKLSATPAGAALPPPLLGQHTDEVLREVLGRSEERSRSGCSISSASNRNSTGVSPSALPSCRMRIASRSTTKAGPPACSTAPPARRKWARTRATTSRGLKGLQT